MLRYLNTVSFMIQSRTKIVCLSQESKTQSNLYSY